jgi:uncharacterized protein DUF1440
MRDTLDNRVAADLLKGAVAGAAATWVMGQVTTWLYDRENAAARAREDRARDGKTAYGVAAEKAAEAAQLEISGETEQQAGRAIHWALGITAGAVYGVLRKRWPATARLKGLPFGTGFFLVFDELLNPVLGLTPGPAEFPWQAHARGLGGHLTFGVVSELVLEGLDRSFTSGSSIFAR